MKRLEVIFFMFAVLVLWSCKPSVPSQYIQPGEMEDILYDYHLAEAMLQDNNAGAVDGYKQQLYQAAVFRKYGVTKAEFDSSLVYYTRHADRLHDIYEQLAKRFNDDAVALGASASDLNKFGAMTAQGDTADIWTGDKSFFLLPKAPYSVQSFYLIADSTYHRGDRIMLNFDAQFIYQDGLREGVAVLAVRFANDSVASRTQQITSATHYSLVLDDEAHLGIREIRGYFMLSNLQGSAIPSTTLRLMSIYHVQLIRMHDNGKKTPSPTDSIAPKDAMPKPDSNGVVPSTLPEAVPADEQLIKSLKQAPQKARLMPPQKR